MGVKSRMLQWQKSPFDSDTQKQVAKLNKFPEKAEDAFYKDLEFVFDFGVYFLIEKSILGLNKLEK